MHRFLTGWAEMPARAGNYRHDAQSELGVRSCSVTDAGLGPSPSNPNLTIAVIECYLHLHTFSLSH